MKRFIRKVQAISIALIFSLSSFDITALATTNEVSKETTTEVLNKSTDGTATQALNETTDGTTQASSEKVDETTQASSETVDETTTETSSETVGEATTETSKETVDENTTESLSDRVEEMTTVDSKAEAIKEFESSSQSTEEDSFVEPPMSYNEVEDITVPSCYDGTYFPSERGTMPPSYSSVTNNYIPTVRNQGSWGTCWSFAAIGAAEANLTRKGISTTSLDLAELQLAYFFYNRVADPLGNTTGDSTLPIGASYLQRGGNSVFTTFALAGWTGAALESKATYGSATTESYTLNNSLAFDDAYHLQNAYWIKMTDRDEIKKMVMENGAVASAYYSVGQLYLNTTYYSATNAAYYYNGTKGTNHAITIVGWDDNFSKDKFATKPTSNGAWLIRNSWGSTFGSGGYFWLSYEDSKLNTSNAIGFVFDFEAGDNYDHNYQYDGSSGIDSDAVYNGGSIANIFTVKGNPLGRAEQLEAVSFAIADVNVDYSIQIYKNLSDGQNPTSGTPMLSTPQIGNTTYEGYYTVKLDTPITMTQGNTFSVVVTLSKPSSSYTSYFCDYTYTNAGWISFTNETQVGQSFVKVTSNSAWRDLKSSSSTARIKAFTSDTLFVQPSSISLSNNNVTLEAGNSTTLLASILPNDTTDKTITWSSSNGAIATVNSSGVVNAVGAGTTTITATTSSGLTSTCQVTVRISPSSISLNSNAATIKLGEQLGLVATVSPNNATNMNVSWRSSDEEIASVDTTGVVQANDIGSTTITATTSNGLTSICQVTVINNEILPSSISIHTNAATKKINEELRLIATVLPSDASDLSVTWESSDDDVASVDEDGVVFVNGIGNAIITATTMNGLTTSCQITGEIGAVSDLAVSSQNTKSIQLTWTQQHGVDGYEIYRYNSKNKKYTKLGTNKGEDSNEYNNRSLSPSTIYKYKVRSFATVNGKKKYGEYSNVLETATASNIPTLSTTSTKRTAKLTWKKVTGSSGYEIYMSDSKAGEYSLIQTLSSVKKISYSQKNLKSKQTYYFKIRTYKTVGGVNIYSGYSKIKSVKVK